MKTINGKTWFRLPVGSILEEDVHDDDTGELIEIRSYRISEPLTVKVEDDMIVTDANVIRPREYFNKD